jgi:hypothetical protein
MRLETILPPDRAMEETYLNLHLTLPTTTTLEA